GHPLGRLRRVAALGFFDQRSVGNTASRKIVVSYAALAEARILAAAPGGDDEGRHILAKEVEAVIEPSAQYRGRPSVVFRGSKHNNGVRRATLIVICLFHNGKTGVNEKHDGCCEAGQQNGGCDLPAAERWNRGHPWPNISAIFSSGIAPSRITRQRLSPWLRSTIVDAISRGEVPPSTMSGMRSSSCS